MFTMVDHNSDVYGISLHPQRPFLYASCSRDTTVRLFSIDGLVSALKIQFLIDPKNENKATQPFNTPEATYKAKGSYQLCSKRANSLINSPFEKELNGVLSKYDFV
jgi:WD40 repeat protein